MSKIVNPSHTTSRRGVDSFALYCSSHKPQILWREETVNDFGIDGEIELTARNQEGKIEATAEILKIQIKATSSNNSYIKNETQTQFEFFAREDDLEYWNKHKLNVVLVIFDDRTEKLYAKKINEIDFKLLKKKAKSIPIIFDKTSNELIKGEGDFLTKFSLQPKGRLSFDRTEMLSTNIFMVKDVPKELFTYPAKFSNSQEVYGSLDNSDYPIFILYSKKVFTFSNLEHFPQFREKFVNFAEKEIIKAEFIQNDVNVRNHYIEIIKKYLKEFFYIKRIHYNKDYSRYYFAKFESDDSRKERYRTRKREQEGERTVVSKYTYGRDTFFKHWAFEIDFICKENLFLVLNPKYIFTKDGKVTLEPKKITRYTNALTRQEYNSQVLDFIHFYFDLFSNANNEIKIIHKDGNLISLTKYVQLPANFNIAIDSKEFKKKESSTISTQNQIELNYGRKDINEN